MIRIPGSTTAVVERDAEAIMPALAQAPTIIPASAESSDQVLSAETADTEAAEEAS